MLFMDVIDLQKSQSEESVSSPFSVALGNFDGVHLGHAELISRAVQYARARGIRSAVWTFSDAPAVIPNKSAAKLITAADEKLELFKSLGVDRVYFMPFEAVRDYSPERFVKEILIEKCGAVCAVCGFNFRFGKGGSGDSDALARLMSPSDCIVVPPVYVGETLVSSSVVRALIEAGEVEAAATLLGRRFSINQPVLEGKRLGRTIGLPTINQNFPEGHVIPRSGVYICAVEIDGREHIGVANVGVRPSVENDTHKLNCETHILDYDGELYGKNVKTSFCRRIRDEKRFESIEALGEQIRRDGETAKEYFSKQ